jgi:hypothetical protein
LSASAKADGVLGWAVSVSECELLINVFIRSEPKALSGLSQKACSRMSRLTLGDTDKMTVGEEAEPNLLMSSTRNTVSPNCPPTPAFWLWQATRKGSRWASGYENAEKAKGGL